jgi:excisionase family DNA binding protein
MTDEIVVRLQLEYPPFPTPETPVAADAPLLYRVGEAAKLLAVGEPRVWELIGSGELPSVKIHSSRRISRAALEGYVARLSGDA